MKGLLCAESLNLDLVKIQVTGFWYKQTHVHGAIIIATVRIPAPFFCPHADTTERLVRPVVSAVPLCPRWIFIVPLYPRADITERQVRPVMSAVPLCPQIILENHYILNTHPLKLISIHGL